MLSDQGSNLDSSEPKSDVLPVTLSDNQIPKFRYIFEGAKLNPLNDLSKLFE